MPIRAILSTLALSIGLSLIIHIKFIGAIDTLIGTNLDFMQKVNADTSNPSSLVCSDKVIQLKNLESISKAQNQAFETYKVGGYISYLMIIASGLFGVFAGHASRRKDS